MPTDLLDRHSYMRMEELAEARAAFSSGSDYAAYLQPDAVTNCPDVFEPTAIEP